MKLIPERTALRQYDGRLYRHNGVLYPPGEAVYAAGTEAPRWPIAFRSHRDSDGETVVMVDGPVEVLGDVLEVRIMGSESGGMIDAIENNYEDDPSVPEFRDAVLALVTDHLVAPAPPLAVDITAHKSDAPYVSSGIVRVWAVRAVSPASVEGATR